MQATPIDTQRFQTDGIVQRADEPTRELKVLVNDDLLAFEVPEGCRICLGEERVRLRRLQPLDYVRISYEQTAGARVARSIQVSWFPFRSAMG